MLGIIKKIFRFSGSKRTVLTRAIVVAFIGAVFTALQFGALLYAAEALLSSQTSVNMWVILGILLVSVLGRMVCFYFSVNDETEAGYFMVAEKRVHIGDRLRYIPMGYFNDRSLGNIIAVVTTTLGDVENNASRCLVIIIGGFLNTFALTLGVVAVEWRVGLIALAGILMYLVVTELSTRASAATGPKRQEAQENMVEAVLEYIQGMSVVKSYGLEKDNDQAVIRNVKESCDRALELTKTVAPWMAVRQLIVRLFAVLILVASLIFYKNGTLTLPMCILMLIVSFMIYQELESAGNMSDNLQMLAASMDTADEIDKTPVMDIEGKDLAPKSAAVTFEDVSFSYSGDTGARKILDHVSFTIPSKTTTAVVGPSGGGKTTMCSLIARFWDVDGGKITVGGTDVKEYKLDSLMKNISMVFQNVYLFQDTIENNIKFGKPDATHEEVVAAAKAACCHDFIEALQDGYQTVVGEGGGSLSGGEKQRISIARAILKDAPIIILDEATASVDPENEDLLQAAIEALTHDKTIIMIAHRLKTVRHADQILVLNHGHIEQQGTHEQLAGAEGLYKEFLNAREKAAGWKLA